MPPRTMASPIMIATMPKFLRRADRETTGSISTRCGGWKDIGAGLGLHPQCVHPASISLLPRPHRGQGNESDSEFLVIKQTRLLAQLRSIENELRNGNRTGFLMLYSTFRSSWSDASGPNNQARRLFPKPATPTVQTLDESGDSDKHRDRRWSETST